MRPTAAATREGSPVTTPRVLQGERRSWQVELDVSAPQILFAEELCDRDASVLVVDFGRLRLTNTPPAGEAGGTPATPPGEDEEMFMTPCSTPPASLLSPAEPPEPLGPASPPNATPLDAADLHTRLYDRCGQSALVKALANTNFVDSSQNYKKVRPAQEMCINTIFLINIQH